MKGIYTLFAIAGVALSANQALGNWKAPAVEIEEPAIVEGSAANLLLKALPPAPHFQLDPKMKKLSEKHVRQLTFLLNEGEQALLIHCSSAKLSFGGFSRTRIGRGGQFEFLPTTPKCEVSLKEVGEGISPTYEKESLQEVGEKALKANGTN